MVNATDFSKHIAHLLYLEAQESGVKEIPKSIIKVMVLEQDRQTLKNIEFHANRLNAEVAYSLSYALEINPHGITKAKTLSRLLHAMHLDSLPIYVFGDGENDLPLLNIAQKSFAPDSAHPKVLDSVDFIISREPDRLLTPILEIIQKNEVLKLDQPKRPEM